MRYANDAQDPAPCGRSDLKVIVVHVGFGAAEIRVHGIDVVVSVGRVVMRVHDRDDEVAELSTVFDDLPTVTTAQADNGTAVLYRRHDLVGFLRAAPLDVVPGNYTVAE